ncbi:MAG: hypothetical protein A2Z34_00100 [Planctomycetes bacterium RBG_16_59_8]|nr:MAG: hypothetical protein A2Z34_00100 [Planctomycetes bacterium RBG_16_59_8]
MRTALLSFLLFLPATVALAQNNPIEPKYPFQSCKLTYKRAKAIGVEVEMVVYLKGEKAINISRVYAGGKLKESYIDYSDGKYVYDLELDAAGKVRDAERFIHPWLSIQADYAELSAEEKKKFAEGLPKLWRRWSPIFTLDNLGTTVTEVVSGTEKVAGKECELFECKAKAGPSGGKFWRWQGTNIMLKSERSGAILEVDKIEENVAIPDSVFDLPKVSKWREDNTVFAKSAPQEIFKMLTGKDAVADPGRQPENAGGDDGMVPGNNDPGIDAEIAVEGRRYKLDGVVAELNIDDDGENQLMLFSSAAAPSINVVISIGKAKNVQSLVGKTFALATVNDASNAVIQATEDVSYESTKGTVKILSVGGKILEAEMSGAFKRMDEEGDRDVRLEKLIFKARVNQ